MTILIANNCVVSIHYTLKDDDGELLDTSRDSQPLTYLHGAGNLIPGLESELAGKTAGASFNVSIPPDQAYGVYREELVQIVPLDMFKGVDEVKPGMQFETEGPNGEELVIITEVIDDEVTVDANHPLAGKTLHFEVDIQEVRDATLEEVQHGHAHDPHGHHH
jgi:FKBP-type peptidyl-prolyl cis-trans isomerase SlyD